ncbi:hypothetical protein ACXZ66_01780 [Corynebacterium sp. S7]
MAGAIYPIQTSARLDRAQVERFGAMVDRANAVELLEKWRAEEGRMPEKGGRPSVISDRTVLILCCILATSGRPLHITQLTAMLCADDTTDNALEALGLPTKAQAKKLGDDYRTWSMRWYNRIWRSVKRVLAIVDPFDYFPHGKRLTKAEFDKLEEQFGDETRKKQRWARATEFFNRLITESVAELPEEYRNNWKGDIALDGTFIAGAKKSIPKDPKPHHLMSSDPDGGWYVREGNHKGTKAAIKKSKEVSKWGYEATIISSVICDQGPHNQPHLILAMSMDRPGFKPAQRALEAMKGILDDRTQPRGTIVGDRAYFPGAKPENYHIPLRKAGYEIVGDYPKNQRGKQETYETMKLVEGRWMCPVIPEILVSATEDFLEGLIDKETYEERIEARREYEMRAKGKDDTGESTVFMCPAKGSGKTLYCSLASTKDRSDAKQKRLKRVLKTQTPRFEDRGKCCTNRTSVTIPNSVGAKYRQTGPAYKSAAWEYIYGPYRNIIETRNDLLKNSRGGAAIGDHTRRLMRGFAAAWFFTMLGVVAINLYLIRNFLHRVERNIVVSPPPEAPPPMGSNRSDTQQTDRLPEYRRVA